MKLHILFPIILISAKLFEEAMRRTRLPSVVGAILAGIVLGPVFLGVIPSEAHDPSGYEMVRELASIGLCVLLFRIGLETRFSEFLSYWRPAAAIAVAGMVFPFALGWILLSFLGWTRMEALFAGATLTATSVGVTASVLAELKAEKSREGLLILGAAILDDVLGLLLLSALVAAVTPSLSIAGQVLTSVMQATAFVAAGIFLGPYIVRIAIILSGWSRGNGILFILAFSYLLLLAYAAKAVGLDMIIGAYAAGLAFAGYPERNQVERDLLPLIELLTPLFFILLGASVEVSGFNPLTGQGRQAWGFASLLFLAAIVGKLFAPFCIRLDQINKWAIGSGMMPRGEVGFVFAQIGLMAGIFSPEMFSSIILALIATTFVGPVLLRVSWKPPTKSERKEVNP